MKDLENHAKNMDSQYDKCQEVWCVGESEKFTGEKRLVSHPCIHLQLKNISPLMWVEHLQNHQSLVNTFIIFYPSRSELRWWTMAEERMKEANLQSYPYLSCWGLQNFKS